MSKYKKFALYCGQHEEGSVPTILWEHEEGFEKPMDAIKNIAAIFIEYIKIDDHMRLKWAEKMGCLKCQEAREAKHYYCPNCGAKLRSTLEPITLEQVIEDGAEELHELWRNIFYSTNNDFPYELVELLEEEGWEVWARPGGNGWVVVDGLDVMFMHGLNSDISKHCLLDVQKEEADA